MSLVTRYEAVALLRSQTLYIIEKILKNPLTGRYQYVIQMFDHEICRETDSSVYLRNL